MVQTEVYETVEDVCKRAANHIVEAIKQTLAERPSFSLALSGGRTPSPMFEILARADLPWDRIDVFQVDERIAAIGSPIRNLTGIINHLASIARLPLERLHQMPVETQNPEDAASEYEKLLIEKLGQPPILDFVHLGLGPDGHTGSLVPNCLVLDVMDHEVGFTQPYQGRRRITLTYPAINRARQRLFLVTGEDKRDAVAKLLAGDPSIPAGKITHENTILVMDRSAAPADMVAA